VSLITTPNESSILHCENNYNNYNNDDGAKFNKNWVTNLLDDVSLALSLCGS